jgi:hypothetical protein
MSELPGMTAAAPSGGNRAARQDHMREGKKMPGNCEGGRIRRAAAVEVDGVIMGSGVPPCWLWLPHLRRRLDPKYHITQLYLSPITDGNVHRVERTELSENRRARCVFR